jgi:hypothetical protein
MRILDIRERSVAISRQRDPSLPSPARSARCSIDAFQG